MLLGIRPPQPLQVEQFPANRRQFLSLGQPDQSEVRRGIVERDDATSDATWLSENLPRPMKIMSLASPDLVRTLAIAELDAPLPEMRDAVYFHLYGVTNRDDICYIYSTFWRTILTRRSH